MSYEYYLNVLQNNYANFNGRARRSEYWFFTLFNTIAIISLAIFSAVIGSFGFILVLIYFLGIITPLLALITRRLHDIGKSGWFYLVAFIPLVGGIWILVLFCTDSNYGPNQYGLNPKGLGNEKSDEQAIKSIGTPIQ